MARSIEPYDPDHDGILEIEEVHPNFVEVYFVPPEHRLVEAGLDPKKANNYRTKLLDINGQHNFLTIYPISTFGNRPDFLKPKYGRIERITLDDPNIIFGFDMAVPPTPAEVRDVLENLPSTFTKDYAYGLGVQFEARLLEVLRGDVEDSMAIRVGTRGVFARNNYFGAVR